MNLLQELNEMEEQKGKEADAIRAAMKKYGVAPQRVMSRNHKSGDMARGSYSDKRKDGRAVKIYAQDNMSQGTKDDITYEIKKSLPDATVTFGPGKKLHGYSDPSAWVRVNVKESVADDNEQLDEGILQSVFDFMWNMAGKIPSVAANRNSAKLEKQFMEFKEKMTDAKVDEWMEELTSKLKSEHPSTMKAKLKRVKTLRSRIKSVKNSKDELRFGQNMRAMQINLRDLKNFVTTSNRRVIDRNHKARADKIKLKVAK